MINNLIYIKLIKNLIKQSISIRFIINFQTQQHSFSTISLQICTMSEHLIQKIQEKLEQKRQIQQLEQDILKEEIIRLKGQTHKKHLLKVKQYQNVAQSIFLIENQYEKNEYAHQINERCYQQELSQLQAQKQLLSQRLHDQSTKHANETFKKSLNLNFLDVMEQRHRQLRLQSQQLKSNQKYLKIKNEKNTHSIDEQKESASRILKKSQKISAQIKFYQLQLQQQSINIESLKCKEQQQKAKFQTFYEKNIKQTNNQLKQLMKIQNKLYEEELGENVIQQKYRDKMMKMTQKLQELSIKRNKTYKQIQNQEFKSSIMQKKITNLCLQLYDLQAILQQKRQKSSIMTLHDEQVYFNQFQLNQEVYKARVMQQKNKIILKEMIDRIQLLKQAKQTFCNIIKTYKISDELILEKVCQNKSKMTQKICELDQENLRILQQNHSNSRFKTKCLQKQIKSKKIIQKVMLSKKWQKFSKNQENCEVQSKFNNYKLQDFINTKQTTQSKSQEKDQNLQNHYHQHYSLKYSQTILNSKQQELKLLRNRLQEKFKVKNQNTIF